jgi:hypothetical protein
MSTEAIDASWLCAWSQSRQYRLLMPSAPTMTRCQTLSPVSCRLLPSSSRLSRDSSPKNCSIPLRPVIGCRAGGPNYADIMDEDIIDALRICRQVRSRGCRRCAGCPSDHRRSRPPPHLSPGACLTSIAVHLHDCRPLLRSPHIVFAAALRADWRTSPRLPRSFRVGPSPCLAPIDMHSPGPRTIAVRRNWPTRDEVGGQMNREGNV